MPGSEKSRQGRVGKILVVDDSPTIRKSFRRTLETAGYEVDEAESGEAALKACRTTAYDMIFLDLVLPGQNGIETFKQLRSIHHKPVVSLMSAHADEMQEELKEAWQLGLMKSFLRKPLTEDEILRVVNERLK